MCHVPLFLTGAKLLTYSGTSRRELVDEMLMLEQASFAEQLCMLNGWDRHNLNSHQLETGLKYRQLDVVQNVLNTIGDEQLDYACSLLVTTVDNAFNSSKGRDFASRLLKVALEFMTNALHRTPDAPWVGDVTGYLTSLRRHLHRISQAHTSEGPPDLPLMESIINNISEESEQVR